MGAMVLLGVLIAAVVVTTRGPAPWRIEVTNDEFHHLESWRNRYRTDDIFPLFLDRLEGRLPASVMSKVQWAYDASPLVQRGFIVLVDPQPPAFPVIAEVIEATTHSSLTGLRLPSAIASMLAVWLSYLVGRELRDKRLGIWLAAFAAIGGLVQTYACVGRPYPIAHMALTAAVWGFVREMRHDHPSPWRFLLLALAAQTVQWMLWAPLSMLVLASIVRRYVDHRSVRRLIGQYGWYLGLSVLLLVEMMVQLMNPTVSGQAGTRSLAVLWEQFAIASPFSHLDGLGEMGLWIGGGLTLGLIALGTAAWVITKAEQADRPALRYGLAASLVAACVAMIFVGSEVRFTVTYMVVPTLFAAIGAWWLTARWRGGWVIAALVVLSFGVLGLVRPMDPYARVFYQDSDYSRIAATLKAEMAEGDVWAGWPYYRANCLYRQGLPTPAMLLDGQAFEAWLAACPPGRHAFVVTDINPARLPDHPEPAQQWEFRNRWYLLKLPPSAEE